MAVVSDHDRDSLHILPLSIVPLESPVLQKTRMIKNTHLDSVVEMFDGKDTGSGQIKIEALGMVFEGISYADMTTLNKLARLNSYDVYSLRILLRKQGVDVDEGELRLSQNKQKQLTNHMRIFTRPLINYIYGDDRQFDNFADALQLLSHPDVKAARQKLMSLSDRLGISLDQVPKFLEDYGDTFLSIGYYRDCMGSVGPSLKGFQVSVDEICENRLLQHDRTLMDTCQRVRGTLVDLSRSVNQRFRAFEIGSKNIWAEIDASRFFKFRELVHNNQTMMGGVLCGLSLKMDAWKEQFPDDRFGGPMKRAEFIMSEMQQGLDRYRRFGIVGQSGKTKSQPRSRSVAPARMWSRSTA